jgi:hypothetical protein
MNSSTTSLPLPGTTSALTLDQQLIAFRQNRFLTMPLSGMLVWIVIGFAGAFLPPPNAVLVIYLGTGVIFYLALCVAKLLGEDILGRTRKGNLFDRIFLSTCAMSALVYALAIPFHLADPTSVPLSVGVLTGLMWLPFSVMAGHWVGYFHAVARTVLLVAAWFLFPENRFTVLPAIVVAVYLVSIAALVRRWRALQASRSVSIS